MFRTTNGDSSVGTLVSPDLRVAVLQRTPFLRVADFLPGDVANELYLEVRDGIEYERVEFGHVTRQWRAARPVGGVYFDPMIRKQGWHTSATAEQALDWLESPQFLT